MNRSLPGILLLVLTLPLVMPSASRAQTVDDFEARSYTDGANTLPYRLWVPRDYDPEQAYPVVLFLHGAGERGNDNRRQLSVQTAPLVFVRPQHQAQWPCFMIAPQCPTGGGWTNGDGAPNPSTWLRLTIEALGELFGEFNLDPTRLYITGLSMGGYGTWDAITRWPGLFAAAIPICGGGADWLAKRCAKTPVWAFHSDDDPVVPVERTRQMIAAILRARGTPLYTEYTGYGHFSWNPAYAEPNLLPWMFAQSTWR